MNVYGYLKVIQGERIKLKYDRQPKRAEQKLIQNIESYLHNEPIL